MSKRKIYIATVELQEMVRDKIHIEKDLDVSDGVRETR